MPFGEDFYIHNLRAGREENIEFNHYKPGREVENPASPVGGWTKQVQEESPAVKYDTSLTWKQHSSHCGTKNFRPLSQLCQEKLVS